MSANGYVTRRGVLQATGAVAVSFSTPTGRASSAAPITGPTYGIASYNLAPEANISLFPDSSTLETVISGARELQADLARLYRAAPLAADSFGAHGDGIRDDAAAINAALATGRSVVLSDRAYAIGSTIRLAADGQSLTGRGAGNKFEPPRTQLKWIGRKGGTMIAVSDGITKHRHNCTVAGINLDGNTLASTGIEGYSAAIKGGCWRNRYDVSITGLAASSVGIDLGAGNFPDFAHDVIVGPCFISDATVGIIGKGSKHKLYGTTFSGCDTAVSALTGSDWAAFGVVYSQCGWDIDMGAGAGFHDFGPWHEDSRHGIVRCAISMTLTLNGGYYHTRNTVRLIDLGNAQGYFIVTGQVGPTSHAFNVVNVNPNTEYSAIGSNVVMAGGYRQVAQGPTLAERPAFAAGPTADHARATGDGTPFALKVDHVEQYDTASAFTANMGTFTAPVAGRYQFMGAVSCAGVVSGHGDAALDLVTSRQTHLMARLNPGAIRTDGGELVLAGGRTVALAAGDTAYLQVTVSGSTRTVEISSGGSSTNWRTLFTGALAT